MEFKYRDHGWFVGFAPVDHPKIVVAVLAMHDCHPYAGANGVVRDVIKAGADGAIVGSAIVKIIEENLKNKKKMVEEVGEFVKSLKVNE